MAIAQVGSGITATNGSTASTTLTSSSYSVANNEVAIIAIQLSDTGAVSSISDSASRSWTFINAANHSGGSCRIEFWRYVNTSGSTKTGTTTVNTASSKKTFVIGIYLDNVRLDICAKNRGSPGPRREQQHSVPRLSQADMPPITTARPEAEGSKSANGVIGL